MDLLILYYTGSNDVPIPLKIFSASHNTCKAQLHANINIYPHTPYFYIEILGFTGEYNFCYFDTKHKLWVLVRTALNNNIHVKDIKLVLMIFFFFFFQLKKSQHIHAMFS